jgi:hypothetical protein
VNQLNQLVKPARRHHEIVRNAFGEVMQESSPDIGTLCPRQRRHAIAKWTPGASPPGTTTPAEAGDPD